MAPPRGRGHQLIEDRSSSAVHAALLTSLMTALARLLRMLLLAATLLLLTGLLPAATLLLTRARIALLRLARLRLVRIVHILSPACWLPQRARTLTRGTAESCDAKRPIARAKLAPIAAPISPKFRCGLKAPSHPLVSTIVVDERGTVGPGTHRFDRAEKYVVTPDRSDLDDAAIKRDHGRGEHRTASRQRQPISAREPIAARDAGAAREYVGDLRATVSQRVDAKYAVLHHDRIGLAAAIEAHEQRGRRVRN